MEKNKFRCHFSVIIENLGASFWLILAMLFSQLDSMMDLIQLFLSGKITFIEVFAGLGIFFLIVVIILVVQIVMWAKTWISIEEDAIVIERTTINRKVNAIGIQNISNINVEQNLFERILGTYTIKLDTNSITTANKTDVKIVLSEEMAEYVQEEILKRINAKEGKEAVAEEIKYDVEASPKDIVMHCVYRANLFAVVFVLAFLTAVIVALWSVNTGKLVLDGIIGILGSLVALLFLAGSMMNILIRDFFVYFNFKARRKDDKIYLSHGLLKKRQYTMKVDKINAIEISSPIIARLCKRQFVKVICVGVGDEQNENSVLLLADTPQNISEKMKKLLPEFVTDETELIPRHKKSIWCEIPRQVIAFGIVMAVTVFCIYFWNDRAYPWVFGLILIFTWIIFALGMLSLYLNFKTCAIGFDQNALYIVKGSFGKYSMRIPYHKIQEIEYKQGPICRRLGIANGVIYILSTMLSSVNPTTYVSLEIFERIKNKMLERKGKKTGEELLKRAEAIATAAHEGQLDKAGIPYIYHPKTVSSYCTSMNAKIVGWLHDVIEDTDVTMEDLRKEGFNEDLLEALDCVTKPKVGYDERAYYERIKGNELAKEVKLADLKHNSDMSRIPTGISEEEHKKWIVRKEKYLSHIRYLTEE